MTGKYGTKRTCLACNTRFFDMEKNPFTCPKCGREMTPEDLWKARGVGSRAKRKDEGEIEIDTSLLDGAVEDGIDGGDMAILEDTSDLGGDDGAMRAGGYDDSAEDEENM